MRDARVVQSGQGRQAQCIQDIPIIIQDKGVDVEIPAALSSYYVECTEIEPVPWENIMIDLDKLNSRKLIFGILCV